MTLYDGTELPALGRGGLSHRRPAPFDRFPYGAAYYPEHWDAETRRDDARRMAAAGFNVVRMAEFAWDLIEPEEGRFEFAFFDAVLDELARHGIRALLCTPTAAPPRWVTVRYPGVVRVDDRGSPLHHGSRQHACLVHPEFRRLSRAVTAAMARHYAGRPEVAGWQTDNEFFCHFAECHCAACAAEFPAFLRRRYGGDVGRLNDAWGTAFWAQTYARFEDVPTPRRNRPTFANPGHLLDYHRFLSDAAARFQHEQVEILRRADPRWFVFHNGLFAHKDYRGPFTRDLDVLGYDCYPGFVHDPGERPAVQAFGLDRARAWSGNFIVPEQQSGPGGQEPYLMDTPEPGEMRRMAYASIARGADGLLFFRWRTCRFGAEQYWCGLLDHDNVPRRRYEEAARLGRELRDVGPAILGTSVFVEAAVCESDMEVDDAHGGYSLGLPAPSAVAAGVHRELLDAGFAAGCVHPADDLAGLKLLVVPHWAFFRPEWVPNLRGFVEGGGTLVVGARTATRTPENRIEPGTLPGVLRELCGVAVEEYGRQNCPQKRPLAFALDGAGEVPTELWYEALSLEGAAALATWGGRHLRGKPAVSTRRCGAGRVVYAGTYLTRAVFRALLPGLAAGAGLRPLWPDAPAGVQVARRDGPGRRVWFFLSPHDAAVVVPRTPHGRDLTRGTDTGGGALALEPHGVAAIAEPA